MSEDSKRTKHQTFDIVEMHRTELKKSPYNPRQIKPTNRSRLKKGLQKHGLVEPLIYNKRTGNLVSGHQRLSILDDLEKTEDYTLQVSVIDVSEDREMALNLLLNNRSAQGEDNLIMLQNVFEELLSNDVNVEDAGYTTTDMQQMFPDIFLTGEAADQLEAEREIVDQLDEMAEVGKEYEGQFRDEAGLSPTKAMLEQQAREAEALASVEATEPTQLPPDPSNPDWKHDKDYFKGERKRTVDNNAEVMNETDVLITFQFQTKKEMEGFMQAFNLDPAKRYFDVHEVQAAFGVEL